MKFWTNQKLVVLSFLPWVKNDDLDLRKKQTTLDNPFLENTFTTIKRVSVFDWDSKNFRNI